jgi:hypothetical protein
VTQEIHKNDIGVKFEATFKDGSTVIDISNASVKQLIFEKTDGTTVTQTANFLTDGSDGIIYYTTILGDLDQSGDWQVQGYIEMSTGKWHSDIYAFTVYSNVPNRVILTQNSSAYYSDQLRRLDAKIDSFIDNPRPNYMVGETRMDYGSLLNTLYTLREKIFQKLQSLQSESFDNLNTDINQFGQDIADYMNENDA